MKRAWLEKDDGGKRQIGMPVFEDKIAQRAVAMILGAVYEQDFESISHGFREGHSQHQALLELREKCREIDVAWIVDADVAGFFDNLDHGLMLEIIKKRVNDGGVLRLIGKWINAGVMEGTTLIHPEKGTPQGGAVSPVLSNIFLHQLLDQWYVREVKPRLRGPQGSKVMRQSGVGALVTEEPDVLIGHVRICGGPGWATAGPTRKRMAYSPR